MHICVQVYSLGGTGVSLYLGRKLVGLNFEQEAQEANFRWVPRGPFKHAVNSSLLHMQDASAECDVGRSGMHDCSSCGWACDRRIRWSADGTSSKGLR